MKKINEILAWLNGSQVLAYSLIRVFLGLALFIRGLLFIMEPARVIELVSEESLYMWFSFVTLGHLIGGALMILGFQTRLAALFQVPILIGAVFIVHANQNLAVVNQSLELAVMVLVLLVVFSLFGSGSLSVDNYLANMNLKRSESTDTNAVPN